MTVLKTDDRLARPDDIYQALVDAHDGLTDAESRQANARLILLLANHIGDEAVLEEAAKAARQSVLSERDPTA